MKKSEIFLKAAELIELGKDHYACTAIESAQNIRSPSSLAWSDAADWYQDAILPYEKGFPYEEQVDRVFIDHGDERQHARIVALCFAAAIAEDEE